MKVFFNETLVARTAQPWCKRPPVPEGRCLC